MTVGEQGSDGTKLEGEPSGRRGRLVRAALGAVVIASVIVTVATQWSRVPDIAWRWEPQWLAASVACFTLFLASHGEIWRLMLPSMGTPIPGPRARLVYAGALLARYVPTGVLSFVAFIVLAEREGVPKRVSSALLLYQMVLSLAAAVALAAYFLVSLPELEGERLRWAAVLIPAAGLLVLHPRSSRPRPTGRSPRRDARGSS